MMRGTTPTHTFTLPVDSSFISKLRIIYAQAGKQILVKENEDCLIEGNKVTVRLSQIETFLFDHMKYVEIQVRILTAAGDVPKIQPIKVSVERCLDDTVMV